MELKVWVDGIQRVVCGASYSTTCQDVVLALASAMGRTGRFTLVEKWRDSERPLFPNEYPLQSLHKWGEYAGEVRFYLVQAETDLVKPQEVSEQRKKTQTFSNFVNKCNPPQPSHHHLKPVEAASLKRSSTFSGAHRTNSAALPLSLSSLPAQKSTTLSQYTYNKQQPSGAASTSSARSHLTGLVSLPNGKVAALSSASSSDSSSSSSSTSLRYLPQNNLSSGQSSELHPVPSARGDARELHPANMPGTVSSYFVQGKDFPSYSSSFSQYSSPQSAMVPSQQLQPAFQHSHQKHLTKPLAISSMSAYETSSKFRVSPDTSVASQSLHSVSSQQSNLQRLQSQQPSSQNGQSEPYLRSDKSHQRYPQSYQSQQTYSQNSQSQQLCHVPNAQHQLPLSSVGYKNTPPSLRQHRERVHYRNSHSSKSVPTSDELQGPSRSVINNINTRPTQELNIDNINDDHLNDNVFDDDADESHRGSHHIQSENIPQQILNSYSSGIQERPKSKDIFKVHTDNRSATLDRCNTRSKINRELPSRSVNTGNHGDTEIKNYLHSEFDVNQCTQGEEGNKLTFVDSATKTHQKTTTGGSNPKTSSFTSAVAYIRNHGESHLNSSQAKVHTRQQASNINQKHGTLGKEVSHGARASFQAAQSLDKSGTITNGYNSHQPLQMSPKPPVPLNSISSSQHKSAFTEVSPKSSHQESSSSLSSVPTGFNLATSCDSYQKQNSKTSLEVEEYDLDQNFPDVLNGQVTNVRGADGDYNMFLKQHLDLGIKSSQTEGDHMRLLRTIHVQQERIKTQEAQINDTSLEIEALEQEESSNITELEALSAEICQLEEHEAEIKMELDNLEKTDWLTVLTGEKRREADIKMKVTSVREMQIQIESQIKQVSEEADHKSKELRLEEERISDENKKNEELERTDLLQIVQMTDQLASLSKTIDERNKKLKDIETRIQETDITLKQKDEKVKAFKEELQGESAEGPAQSSPLYNELFNNAVPAFGSFSPSPVIALSTSDTGEAILKILEGRLSPHSSNFPLGDGDDSLGVTSAQHNYKSAMAVKNPNGVWV